MKSKIIVICLLVLIGAFSVFAGQWSVLYGNMAMMAMHCVFVALFFSYLPTLIFKAEGYRLVSYVIEILLGFMVFFFMQLNCLTHVENMNIVNWVMLMMFDSVAVMAVGFGGAMLYARSTKY